MSRARCTAQVAQTVATDLCELLGKIGIQLSHATLWTEERMERGLMSDSEAVKDSTVSVSFYIDNN